MKQWVDLFLSGSITVGGLVDGIDIAAHAVNVSAHHIKTTAAEISLADLLEKSHLSLTNVTSDQHHAQVHGHAEFLKLDGTRYMEGNLIPNADSTHEIGASALRWLHGWFDYVNAIEGIDTLGNITVGGLVDDVDIALQATKVRSKVVNESAIGDGKVMVYRTVSGELGYEAQAGGGGGGPTKIAHDYPERDITETSETIIHTVHVIKSANVNIATLIVQAEGEATIGELAVLKIYEGANLRITLSWIGAGMNCVTGTYDASGWANGKHTLTAKVYVSGGTGRLEMVEYWVEE